MLDLYACDCLCALGNEPAFTLCILTIMSCPHFCGLSFSTCSYAFSLFPALLFGQALERQKEYFDCIRNERDELRDELADLKEKTKAVEVCQ